MNLRLVPAALCLALGATAQNLPDHWYTSPDGRVLYTNGRDNPTGFYRPDSVRALYLNFPQTNYWTLLTNNYNSQTPIPATMVFDGVTYDSVGVRFKGQTSYSMLPPGSQKKSFDIKMDEWVAGQDVKGYESLNLNNSFQDNSFMREVVYERMIRRHIPAAKANYVKLYINGANWGLYPNIQGLDGTYIKEWYFNNDGIRWRADRPPGSGGGGGGGWGDGTAALNWHGTDTADYQDYYTLQNSEVANPWDQLVRTCDELNNTPLAQLEDSLNKVFNVDRALWFLACEIAFGDDDSYIYKGKMDYSLYWDAVEGRMNMQEYDGNSVLENMSLTWSAFHNQTNANYPLMNRLFAVPALRQRYLAHLRTVIADGLDALQVNQVVNDYEAMIDTIVQNDPKKLMTYAQWTSGVTSLLNSITTRRNSLNANTEVAQVAPTIGVVDHLADGVLNGSPQAGSAVDVTAAVTSTNGIFGVTLYWSPGLTGLFSKVPMLDDGAHNDGAAGDGIYGAQVPGNSAGTWVRYYIEAAANNAAHSVKYSPVGAEHDVYIYQVQVAPAPASGVVINEVMASNATTATDFLGEYDDWIELYNNGANTVDLSGWFLSDTPFDLTKWQVPTGTTIGGNDYLIIWADEDGVQGNAHANFKLSASGESVVLTNADTLLVDQTDFGGQTTDMGWARVPNGTGSFTIQGPTFSANNNTVGLVEEEVISVSVYPNPATDLVNVVVRNGANEVLEVFDATGRSVWRGRVNGGAQIGTAQWSNGTYHVCVGGSRTKLVVMH